ncbi:MAG: hypothetical protein LDL41_06370 [Coleofasciculus sp. S288]|nr:hypothetical protein [Coleofasciculus sp. S288]
MSFQKNVEMEIILCSKLTIGLSDTCLKKIIDSMKLAIAITMMFSQPEA